MYVSIKSTHMFINVLLLLVGILNSLLKTARGQNSNLPSLNIHMEKKASKLRIKHYLACLK